MVIAYTNQKGGTGKSTIAFKTAQIFQLKGVKVCLIDLDKQLTCKRNKDMGLGGFEVFYPFSPNDSKKELDLSPKLVEAIIAEKQKKYDICILDMAGTFDDTTIFGLKHVDIVIIPLQASQNDIVTTVTFVKYLEFIEEHRQREFKKIALLPNRIKSGSNDLKNINEFKRIKEIKEKHYMFQSFIADLQTHKNYQANLDILTEDFASYIKELMQIIKN